MANRAKFTDRVKEKFLAHLRDTCNVSESARACGVSRRCAYDHKEADPDFSRDWDDAVEEAADKLEREAWRRAVEGTDKPVTFQGVITDTYKEYSDRMLELLLKSHRPDKYRERSDVNLRTPDGIQVEELTRGELQERKAHLANRIAALQQSTNGQRNGDG
jgi:hypothetical protein